MKYHLQYLKYVLRHKWYVFIECFKLGIPFQGFIHDWSKFLPDEWIPYANFFYRDKTKIKGQLFDPSQGTPAFNYAWLKHQHRNPHHWQYWILVQDEDDNMILDMPMKYRKEMLADWIGAGKAQGHGNDIKQWHLKNKDKIKVHSDTEKWLQEQIL